MQEGLNMVRQEYETAQKAVLAEKQRYSVCVELDMCVCQCTAGGFSPTYVYIVHAVSVMF